MYTPFIEDDETIDQYCDDMIKDGIWGGQLEMNALANSMKFNVIVHQVDNPSMAQVFNEPIGSCPTIHVSFHLGEHYNCVRRVDDPCHISYPPIEHYPIGHQLELIQEKFKGQRYNSLLPENVPFNPLQRATGKKRSN